MRKVGTILLLVAGLALVYYLQNYEEPAPTSAETSTARAPAAASPGGPSVSIRLVTWNMLNLGKSKTDEEIDFIADQVRDFDIVAVQEVNTRPDGAQTVARLDDALDRRGARWDYVVSDPTSGTGTERYAYLWKSSRLSLAGRPWLAASLADDVDREPYMARFKTSSGDQMLLASFHAVPRAKRPADEVVLLVELHRAYPDDHLLIMGDFNLAQRHQAFDELKAAGFEPAVVQQKTSLRMRRKDGEHLANEYDNIFYESHAMSAEATGVIDFSSAFRTLKQAREISDHIPVYMTVRWK